jgi:predicted nucleotidyltransferase
MMSPVEKLLEIRRNERQHLLERIIALLENDERVVAAWLGGSLGRKAADDLSDLDLWVVVADQYCQTICTDRQNYVAAVQTETTKPILKLESPFNAPPGGAYLLVFYAGIAGPQHVDWYWQPQSKAHLSRQTLLLFDKVGLPTIDSSSPFANLEQLSLAECIEQVTTRTSFFWAMLNITAKKIAREEVVNAVNMLTMLEVSIAEVCWYMAGKRIRPSYEDIKTESSLIPLEPTAQIHYLQKLAKDMETLTPSLLELGATSIPSETISQIMLFVGLAEQVVTTSK